MSEQFIPSSLFHSPIGNPTGYLLPEDYSVEYKSEDLITRFLPTLRNLSRQIIRQNPIGAGYVNSLVDNVVGASGINLQIEDKNKKNVIKKWKQWTTIDKFDNAPEISGLNFHEVQRLVCSELIAAGEAFIIVLDQRLDDSKAANFQIQIVESERIPVFYKGPVLNDNNSWINGIEFTDYGKPVRYAIMDSPHEVSFIPARNMIHIYKRNRPTMRRGIPALQQVLNTIKTLVEYHNSENKRAKKASQLMGIIQTQDSLRNEPVAEEEQQQIQEGEIVIRKLKHGETMNVIKNDGPNSNYGTYTEAVMKIIGVGSNVSYESVSGDYSKSNYSSSRLSMQREREHFQVLQKLIIEKLCNKVFYKFIQASYTKQQEYNFKFMGKGWQHVDLQKEMTGYETAVKNAFMTRHDVCAKAGLEYDEVIETLSKEVKDAEALGLDVNIESKPQNNNESQQNGNKEETN